MKMLSYVEMVVRLLKIHSVIAVGSFSALLVASAGRTALSEAVSPRRVGPGEWEGPAFLAELSLNSLNVALGSLLISRRYSGPPCICCVLR